METLEKPLETVSDLGSLPSGRSVVVKIADGQERLEVRSPSGQVEVLIQLTAAGVRVQLQAAELELKAPSTIHLDCRRLEIDASEGARLKSGGAVQFEAEEMRVQTSRDIHLNGDVIRLNCENSD